MGKNMSFVAGQVDSNQRKLIFFPTTSSSDLTNDYFSDMVKIRRFVKHLVSCPQTYVGS